MEAIESGKLTSSEVIHLAEELKIMAIASIIEESKKGDSNGENKNIARDDSD